MCISRYAWGSACVCYAYILKLVAAQDQGPPEEVVEAGVFVHPCEGEAVCKLTNEKVRQIAELTCIVNKLA